MIKLLFYFNICNFRKLKYDLTFDLEDFDELSISLIEQMFIFVYLNYCKIDVEHLHQNQDKQNNQLDNDSHSEFLYRSVEKYPLMISLLRFHIKCQSI